MSERERPKCWFIRRQSIKHKWQVPFVFFVEWPCEWILYWLKEWAFLDILARLGHLAIIVAVIFYIKGCHERQMQSENLKMQVENMRQQLANQQKAKHYQAWQVINAAQGKPGSCGRKEALEDLHKDEVHLAGIDISKAYITELNLAEAYLLDANLAAADLVDANLAEAYLAGGNFTEANLFGVNLTGTFLYIANFTGTNLYRANLTKANLWNANLAEADLTEANLSNTILKGIENWQKIKSIENANIYGVKNAPEGFIEWAKEQGAVEIEDRKEWLEYREKKKQEQVQQ